MRGLQIPGIENREIQAAKIIVFLQVFFAPLRVTLSALQHGLWGNSLGDFLPVTRPIMTQK